MHTKMRRALIALATAVVLAQAAGAASAARFSVDGQSFRITWSTVRFFGSGNGGFLEARCPVTLEGSFHARTFAKRIDAIIGTVTRAFVPAGVYCQPGAGEASFLSSSLPWPVHYASFSGLLPNITRMRVWLEGVAFKLRYFASCLFEEGGEHIFGEFLMEGPYLNRFTWNTEELIERSPLSTECLLLRAGMEGTGRVTFLGQTLAPVMTLI